MKRKLLSLVVAVAAFAVMPAAAQAIVPHWYKNAKIQAAGTPLQVVTFGGAANLKQISGLGEINCKGVGGGFDENPVGGGAGTGKVQASEFYTCLAPQCEAQIKEKFGVSGRGEVRTENLPLPQFGGTKGAEGWNSKLFEGGAPSSVRDEIGTPWTSFPSPNQKEGETPAGMIRATVLCTIPALKAVAVEAIFEGSLTPEIGEASSENLNGLSASKPSVSKFTGATSGALHSELAGEGTNEGLVKYLGYNTQEIVVVKE